MLGCSGIVAHHIPNYGLEEQKRRYCLHGAGELIGAIAMTEPGARIGPAKRTNHRAPSRQQLRHRPS